MLMISAKIYIIVLHFETNGIQIKNVILLVLFFRFGFRQL